MRPQGLDFYYMAKEYAKKFYQSKQWRQCREAFIASVGGLCTRCLKRGEVTAGYIVHHKTYITPQNINDPSVTLNFDNLEYLCRGCHNDEHVFGEEIAAPRWEWKDGELIERSDNTL